jgi:hypothetical protein
MPKENHRGETPREPKKLASGSASASANASAIHLISASANARGI